MSKTDDVYHLYYFQGNCRAMISHAILRYSKAKFEYHVIDFKNWPKEKASGKFEYGQLPSLEVNGHTISQSIAIQFYLSKKFNLMGKSPEEEAQILALFCSFEDLNYFIHEIMGPKNDTEEAKKEYEESKDKFFKKFGFFLNTYEKIYKKNGNKSYFIGDYFTAADIYLALVLYYYEDRLKCGKFIEENAPEVKKLTKKILENELKEFLEKDYTKNSW